MVSSESRALQNYTTGPSLDVRRAKKVKRGSLSGRVGSGHPVVLFPPGGMRFNAGATSVSHQYFYSYVPACLGSVHPQPPGETEFISVIAPAPH